MDTLEKLACKFLIWRFKLGYGADCPEMSDHVLEEGGCGSCKAKLTIDFLKDHIELIDM